MSYTYEQRRAPQVRQEAKSERNPEQEPALPVTMGRPAAPGGPDGPNSRLDAVMRARMESTFGDLSAVRNYTPPARTQAPLQTGPYTGPVTHALSDASPSPSAAGPMQAMRESNSANREYYEDTMVKEGDAGYDDLNDPEKWTTVTRKSWLFGKANRFKAKIKRRAYEMTPEELAANPFNPNGLEVLNDIQRDLDTAPERNLNESDKDYNGRRNRTAWAKFQDFGKNALKLPRTEDEKYWGMFGIDQDILRTKLKSMTRMVHDHPELQGNIGTLIPFSEAFLKRFKTDPEKQEQTDDPPKKKKDKPEKPKTLRKRKKRQLTQAELEARKQSQADEQAAKPFVPYMGTSMSTKYIDEEGQLEGYLNTEKQREDFRREATFPLYMNPETDSNTEEGRKLREARFPKEDVESRRITDLPNTGNHEMGHMLNYLLIKEKNRGLRFDKRRKKNNEDAHFGITANNLIDQALKLTMSEDEYKRLVRYQEDSLGKNEEWDNSVQLGENEEWDSKDTDPAHKKGQINLAASGLSGKYTTKYGTFSAGEFFAEAFADVYRNGKSARPTSIQLVKLYEQEMKKYRGKK